MKQIVVQYLNIFCYHHQKSENLKEVTRRVLFTTAYNWPPSTTCWLHYYVWSQKTVVQYRPCYYIARHLHFFLLISSVTFLLILCHSSLRIQSVWAKLYVMSRSTWCTYVFYCLHCWLPFRFHINVGLIVPIKHICCCYKFCVKRDVSQIQNFTCWSKFYSCYFELVSYVKNQTRHQSVLEQKNSVFWNSERITQHNNIYFINRRVFKIVIT